MCHAPLAADIPINKLSNYTFRNNLKTYTEKDILMKSTLRQGYFDDLCIETVDIIKSEISNKNVIWHWRNHGRNKLRGSSKKISTQR